MLTLEQERALQILLGRILSGEKVSILQGAAGTGKTYLLKVLLESLGYSNNEVAFVSYTGAAAKVLQKTGLRASTIHKLIYHPIMLRGVCVGFSKVSREGVEDLKLIVVDEFSMVSQEIMRDLLSYNIPLLLVGDFFQLSPIGEPNAYVGAYHALLTQVHRQALESPLLWAATQIREKRGLPAGQHGGTLLVTGKSQAREEWFRSEVQIITGLNDTRKKYNNLIAGGPTPQKGHKIIFLKNDFLKGIVNGSMADIMEVRKNYSSYFLDIETDDGIVLEKYKAIFRPEPNQTRVRVQGFDFAYAVTAHKAQGSTFDSPGVIFDESSYFRDEADRWLYVALTRYTGNYNVAVLR